MVFGGEGFFRDGGSQPSPPQTHKIRPWLSVDANQMWWKLSQKLVSAVAHYSCAISLRIPNQRNESVY